MKVVVITHNYIRREGDLTALYLHRLSSGLTKKNSNIVVVCPHAPGLLKEDTIDNVKIMRFKYPFSTRRPIVYTGNMHQEVARSFFAKIIFLCFLRSFYKYALNTCRSVDPDIIWANWWIPPGLVAARISRKLKIPLVISSHGTDIALMRRSGIIGKLSSYVYSRTSRATVVSSYLKKRLLENTSAISSDRVAVIPMPVGMEHFPKTSPPQNETPVFLSVARFTQQKHLPDILAAARKLASEGTAFKIILIGEGPLEEELKKTVLQNGLEKYVDFVPLVAQQKLGDYYRRADAVILVSEGEGFGLVLVEAGLTGRPAIAARSGGIIDIIDDGQNGLMVDLADIDGIAAAMRKIIIDGELREKLGLRAHDMAIERFATPVLVSRIDEIFRSAAGGADSR